MHTAKGRFYKTMCADDILHPDCLKTEYDFLYAHPAIDFCFSNARYIDAEGNTMHGSFLAKRGAQFAHCKDLCAELLKLYYQGKSVVPWTTLLFKRECFTKIELDFSFVMQFDMAMLLSLCLNNKNVGYIHEMLVSYRIHSGQISSSKNKEAVDAYSFFEVIRFLDIFLKSANVAALQMLLQETETDVRILHLKIAIQFMNSPSISHNIAGYLFIHDFLQDKEQRVLAEKHNFSIGDFRMLYRGNKFLKNLSEMHSVATQRYDIESLGIKGTVKVLFHKIKIKFKKKFKIKFGTEKLTHL